MSETNGKAKKSQANRLPREKFYKVLKAFEERMEEYKSVRATIPEVAASLSIMVGFTVGEETAKQLKQMTGCQWNSRVDRPIKNRGIHKQTALRALARAIEDLYRYLGKDVPEGITTLMNQLDVRRRSRSGEDAALPSSK